MADVLLLAKLVATPIIITLVYVIERRFGHAVAGLVFGFPLTSALATAFLAAEEGPLFARDTVPGMMAGITTLGVFLLVFGHTASRRPSWPVALGAAFLAYVPTALLLGWLGLGFAASTLLAVAVLAVAVAGMPRRLGAVSARPHGRWELPLRAAIGTTLVAVLTEAARDLGPVGTGLLLLFPAVTSTLAGFVLARAGPGAVVRMLRAMAWGCFSFVAFFVVVGAALGTMGTVTAFVLAGLAAVGASGVTWRLGVSRIP
ncbi:MAG: hypothetical protein WC876_07515 [Candidatus Thermoplasmatota archaeon]